MTRPAVVHRGDLLQFAACEAGEKGIHLADSGGTGDHLEGRPAGFQTAEQIGHAGTEDAIIDVRFVENEHPQAVAEGAHFGPVEVRHEPGVQHIWRHDEDVVFREQGFACGHRRVAVEHGDFQFERCERRLPLGELVVAERLHGIEGEDAGLPVAEQDLQRAGHEDEALAGGGRRGEGDIRACGQKLNGFGLMVIETAWEAGLTTGVQLRRQTRRNGSVPCGAGRLVMRFEGSPAIGDGEGVDEGGGGVGGRSSHGDGVELVICADDASSPGSYSKPLPVLL